MKFFKEPLLHFLVLGAGLFLCHAALNQGRTPATDEIRISPGQIEHLAATFAKVWQRPPSEQELKEQIDQFVKEEVLSREAMALGLDKNDTVIRRRLQQKMEFLLEDFSAADPTEAELADYLAQHPDKFAEDARLSFRQIYLHPEKRGDQLEADAARLLAELKNQGANTPVADEGDNTQLPAELLLETRRAVESQFGEEFARAVADLEPGDWSGPIRSGYGLHLVFVSQRVEGRVPALADVREAVQREWTHERRVEANRKFLESLLDKYQVVIEWPRPEGATNSTTISLSP